MCAHPYPHTVKHVFSQEQYGATKPSFSLCHIKFAKTSVKTQLFSLTVSSPLFSALLPSHPLSASWDKWLLWDSVCLCATVCMCVCVGGVSLCYV